MTGRGVRAPSGARRALLLGAVLPALVAGCTVGPSSRPPVLEIDGPPPSEPPPATHQVPLPPLGGPKDALLTWEPCDETTRQRLGDRQVSEDLRFSCARISSTLDAPDLPGRGTIRINLLKVGEGKVPLVVVNDIDGEPGTLYAARLAERLPNEVLKTFSLIGVDRRGTGESRPIQCVPADTRDTILGLDPAAENVEPLLDAVRKAGQECSIELKNDQRAYDTWRAAGDLEQLRVELGMSRLHAIARGEGSRVLSVYANRFTNHVGRVALDGIPDPSSDAVIVHEGIAQGAQATLDAFAKDCAARKCPLGADAERAVRAVLDRLRSGQAVGGSRVGPALALHAVLAGLAQRERWPELATAIAHARDGRADELAEFAKPALDATSEGPPRLDGTLVTSCNDTMTRLTPDRIGKLITEWDTTYPVFGALIAQRLLWCGPWPVRREPLPSLDAPGAPPILLASTDADPVTPEVGTIRTADQMSTAVRISWQGAGHGAIGASECVTEKVTEFLIRGTVPREGTLCPP